MYCISYVQYISVHVLCTCTMYMYFLWMHITGIFSKVYTFLFSKLISNICTHSMDLMLGSLSVFSCSRYCRPQHCTYDTMYFQNNSIQILNVHCTCMYTVHAYAVGYCTLMFIRLKCTVSPLSPYCASVIWLGGSLDDIPRWELSIRENQIF